MLQYLLLVLDLLAIIVIVSRIHLEQDVEQEKNYWENVDTLIIVLLRKVVIELVEEQCEWYHDTIPDSQNQNNSVPIDLE